MDIILNAKVVYHFFFLCIHISGCGDQKSTLSAIIAGSLIGLELTNYARLAGQQVQGSVSLHLPSA